MHIEKYTKIPIDDSGENFLYIKNHCLGKIDSVSGAPVAYNIKTGEAFSQLSLYEQIVDEKGNRLENPLTGDNDDYFLIEGEGKKSVVSYFHEIFDSSSTNDPEKKEEK